MNRYITSEVLMKAYSDFLKDTKPNGCCDDELLDFVCEITGCSQDRVMLNMDGPCESEPIRDIDTCDIYPVREDFMFDRDKALPDCCEKAILGLEQAIYEACRKYGTER